MLSCGQRSLGTEGNFDLLLTFLRTCTQPSTVFLNCHCTSPFFSLGQWFSAGRQFCPRGHWRMSGDIFVCRHLRRGCFWNLVGGGQGCYSTPLSAQDAPQTVIQPQCHSAKGRDPAWGESLPSSPNRKHPPGAFGLLGTWVNSSMSPENSSPWSAWDRDKQLSPHASEELLQGYFLV